MSLRLLLLPLALLLVGTHPASSSDLTADAGRSITAHRLSEPPPRIDGALTEQIWWDAAIYDGFVQDRPHEGRPATERTTVQIAYDEDALYVGIEAYDSDPDAIVARLVRRDGYAESDWVEVHLDPYNDNQSGYYFRLNAAGAVGDGYLYDDTREDDTWDGVWEGRSRIHDSGWTAEFRIPYRVLRFSRDGDPVWGINVIRNISRKNERDYYELVPRQSSGWVSRFGHLRGIHGVEPSLPIEVLPYTTFRSGFEPSEPGNPTGRSFLTSAGADLRYGLSPSVSLTATINPDFGQVEADPAVLNLSSFETRFEERRPFFVEGGQMFRTPIDLFYSRRIGRKPGHLDTPDGFDELSRPSSTTILGAAKVTGKTKGRTSFGVLQAVTSPEYALGDTETGQPGAGRRRVEVEPLTSYFVGRLEQDVLEGNSTVGVLATAVNRTEGRQAFSGGLDWNLNLSGNTYRFRGQVAGTRTSRDPGGRLGYAVNLDFDKRSGWARAGAEFEAYSPGFDANDMGFVRRSDYVSWRGWGQLRRLSEWAFSRRLYFGVRTRGSANYEGLFLRRTADSYGWVQFPNYWWLGAGITRSFESFDDRETRGGPAVLDPAWTSGWVEVETDDRKAVTFEGEYSAWAADRGGSRGGSVEGGITFRPTANIELRFRPEYRWKRQFAQWIENVDRNADGSDDTYVFGALKSRVLDFTTRASFTFTRDLTLQLYLQPFLAAGDYSDFKALVRPRSYDFTPYAYDGSPDFARRSLKSNLILRWEYRPGSRLYIVWSQDRSHESDRPDFRLGRLAGALSDEGSNIFLVKMTYWLGL